MELVPMEQQLGLIPKIRFDLNIPAHVLEFGQPFAGPRFCIRELRGRLQIEDQHWSLGAPNGGHRSVQIRLDSCEAGAQARAIYL